MAAPQDFHYMSVLRQLEIEAGILKGGSRASTDRKKVGRLTQIFSQAKRQLALVRVSAGEKISLNLKFSGENQLKVEREMIANLERLSAGPEAFGVWPPHIPVGRMVRCFTATVIGLRAEHPQEKFPVCVSTAFERAVIPALAWGLMVRLQALPAELRDITQEKLIERLKDAAKPSETDIALGGEGYRKVSLPYLRLVEAWFRYLADEKMGGVAPDIVTKLRRTLADLFRTTPGEMSGLLWRMLSELYVDPSGGSDRARAITMIGGEATFIRERLALFAAATRPELQDFRLLTEHRPDQAVRRTFACEEENPPQRTEAGLEACGAAFWLARASFGRHGYPHADAASARAVLLLLRAAVMLRDQPDRVVTCLRYAAGFATNPRYTRSALVCDFQTRLIDLYARHALARRALVEQFRGRLAWQQWKAGDKAAKSRALDHYQRALERHDRGAEGLDSEGPLHFFPELVVLLGQVDDGKRAAEDLATVDFITQRNYGIYFDIRKEQRLIEAGLKEYREWRLARAKEAAEGQVAVESADGDDDEQEGAEADGFSIPSSLLKRSDYRMYLALIRQLGG